VTARDRYVLIVVGALATVAALWFLAIAPNRTKAKEISAQVVAMQDRLSTAQVSATGAQASKDRYSTDYATIARLGKAVPVEDEVPSLLYQLEHVAHDNDIDFRSIALAASTAPVTSTTSSQAAAIATANGTTPAAATSAASAALPPGAVVGAAGFPTMPFTFDFTGSFFNMQRFLKSLDGLTTVKGEKIDVKGRLLTVDGVGLQAGPKGFPQVKASVVVTAYLLPADEGLTGTAATTATPADGTATASTTTGTGAPAAASVLLGSE
jgi:hypothetical protein